VIHSMRVFRRLACVPGVSRYFVCVGIDPAYDIGYIPIIDPAISECIKQVVNIQRKMMLRNASSMVDVTEGSTGVGNGTVERCAEKFTLHSTEFINRAVFKKRFEFRVGQDTIIKIMDKFGDCPLTANSLKKGLLFFGYCSHYKYLSDQSLFHYRMMETRAHARLTPQIKQLFCFLLIRHLPTMFYNQSVYLQ